MDPSDIPAVATATPSTHVTVTLDTPIARGNQVIASLTLRKPKSGELRGISLTELAQLDVGALIRLLPRISSPTLTTPDVEGMDPADLMSCGTEVIGFLFPSAALASLSA